MAAPCTVNICSAMCESGRYESITSLERPSTRSAAVREVHALDHSHAFVSFSDFFRDKKTFDEASPLALKLGAWSEKNLRWVMACQLLIIAYKK